MEQQPNQLPPSVMRDTFTGVAAQQAFQPNDKILNQSSVTETESTGKMNPGPSARHQMECAYEAPREMTEMGGVSMDLIKQLMSTSDPGLRQ